MMTLASRMRPYFGAVVLTTALLTVGGIYSATRMPSGIYPEVSFSRIAVVAKVPGLDIRSMEVAVTRPLEQAISTVIGVAQVRSKTIRGASELSIDFNPGTDMLRAEQLTWNRIGAARSQIPKDVELTLDRMTPSVFPIMSVVLTGGDSPSSLRDYAFYQLAPLVKNIPGVLYANVAGGDLREIEVESRMDDLMAAGLSVADLGDQISKASLLQPVGRIERPPFAFQIIVNTQPDAPKQVEDLVIGTKNRQPLRVRDVADVRVWHQDRVLSIGYGGHDAVVITVFRSPGSNTIDISQQVRDLLASQPPPRNTQATVVYDQATFVSSAVHNVRDAILIGGLFSILILFAFLKSWRATLISALAIPITLAITMLFLHWSGETLNLMSLGGLAVAIGLIIDDTVVVIENIARHLTPDAKALGGKGPSHQSAGTDVLPQTDVRQVDPVDAASGEITGAVVGSTLTTVLVFVPLAFIIGVYGQFFSSLSWALSIAVLVSMVISLTLIPVFAARFLRNKPMPEPGLIYRGLAHGYELLLSVALRFPWATIALSLIALAAGAVLYTGIPNPRAQREENKPPPPPLMKGLQTGLMPAMDEGAFTLDYWAPAGTPLEGTEALSRDIEKVLSENPDIDGYVRRSGAEMGLFATQTNRGDIQIVLRPDEENPFVRFRKAVRPKFGDVEKEMNELGKKNAAEKYGAHFTEEQMLSEGKAEIRSKYRRRPVSQIMKEVEEELQEHFSEHQLKIDLVQIMEDELSDLSGANKPVEIKIFGPEYSKLRELAEKVGDSLEKKGKGRGLRDVNSNVLGGNPDLVIQVDGVRAARLGLNAEDVRRQLEAMYLGLIAGQVRESAVRITDVRVRYPINVRFGKGDFEPERVLNQPILLPENSSVLAANNGSGSTIPLVGLARTVPLSAVARMERTRTPEEQWRENQQPSIYVTAELNPEEAGLGAVVENVQGWMSKINFPAGYRWQMGGHYLRQQEAFRSLSFVMVVAILLVFIMLAFQFQSVVLPLLIFMTQPLSLVSGLFALWVTDTPLNVSSYMGAILLIGLDMKNGILLVEYIQQLRAEGMELRPALLLAGRTRFRPILMTSLAAILGLFPLALGIGPGAQMQQPLAIMVIGGLTANMLFTRVVIPAGYLVLERHNPKVMKPTTAKA